jgi:hypothetical protein
MHSNTDTEGRSEDLGTSLGGMFLFKQKLQGISPESWNLYSTMFNNLGKACGGSELRAGDEKQLNPG